MRRWFSELSVGLLAMALLFIWVGVLAFSRDGQSAFGFVSLCIGTAIMVVALYRVVSRRLAFHRFYAIFGFVPNDRRHGKELFRHLVEKGILDRTADLSADYVSLNGLEAEARNVQTSAEARNISRKLQEAHGFIRSSRRRFNAAIDVASSRWLPAPYKNLSHNFSDWEKRLEKRIR
ncbi:MAG: hypothetical protein HYW89_00310 [Candidatus Sungiibacteriota bacterium]|uniref:Uncharacterized protein n=1 Tax=Candidatus Sungiibacteriota bacterium TaxID=2750080 RepID=A0A7T5RJP8_9BACT|nr:MAG: hypothetical protein HYW89_00310 [Candidatus Sungbacteria bacterium]